MLLRFTKEEIELLTGMIKTCITRLDVTDHEVISMQKRLNGLEVLTPSVSQNFSKTEVKTLSLVVSVYLNNFELWEENTIVLHDKLEMLVQDIESGSHGWESEV
jgi:hypothetical protein